MPSIYLGLDSFRNKIEDSAIKAAKYFRIEFLIFLTTIVSKDVKSYLGGIVQESLKLAFPN
jgi:hypothetical protein